MFHGVWEPIPPLFGAIVGSDLVEFRRDFWHQKTRVHWLSYGVVCVILRLAVLVQCRYNLTLKARYDLHCVESAVKLQPTNQPTGTVPVSSSPACDKQTDGQTDGQTDTRQHIPR